MKIDRLAESLKTPTGMSLALFFGTIATCIFGVILVITYKLSGIQHDLAQGSGSLIQAIWGSAATITAAVVAILLALEALKTAETTNKLQKEANQLSFYESPVFETLQQLISFKRRLDQYALTLFPTLAMSDGLVVPRNAESYEKALREIFDLYQDIYNSESFLLLDEIALSDLMCSVDNDAIVKKLPDVFTMDPFTKDIRPPNCSDLVVMLKMFADNILSAIGDSKDIASKLKVMNELSRSHWEYMHTLKVALNYVDFPRIEEYTERKLGLPKTDSTNPNKPKRADDILKRLALQMINREPPKDSNDNSTDVEKAYAFFKSNLAEIGRQYLEKLKLFSDDENAPESIRNAAKKILEENP